jgi:uncharacterized protein YukE
MSDKIRFDYAKARDLYNVVNESKRSMENLKKTLESEMKSIDGWWKGDSYDDFKSFYDGSSGLKSFLDALIDESKQACNMLTNISDAKKGFEKSASSNFK